MSEAPRKRLIFEGWRFIPHSSAIVLQSYCLAAARRADIEIKVRELPFNGPWSRIGGMFPEALDRVLQGLPTADEGEVADVVVRIGSPIDLAPGGRCGENVRYGRTGSGINGQSADRGRAFGPRGVGVEPDNEIADPLCVCADRAGGAGSAGNSYRCRPARCRPRFFSTAVGFRTGKPARAIWLG